ncbi:hypothetical protein X907_1432 [Glycocaulis alkaliphilus]|uniref:Uncharacterized protein n=1 Tax=Glycocaulis alkaliphilus TaxID=1434191 RepID=A0A3T0E959_9PROT|nr:hypothetical protein [Glycocaulis alkaliphilus]AZU03965.1 hypothetical protein X907_1432 [Glycocaulis alkaliphilus]GGB86382.1 hypothetical protein GCM10007417_28080 [Glycocaulis alkaliphilus]
MKHVLKSSAIVAAALAAPLALAPAAQAQQTYAECISQQRNQQVTGAVVGGLLGAVLGAQIHNSNESARRDRHYQNQAHNNRGWRGHRGRGYVEPYNRRSNDGAVIAGAGLGALAGGAMGSVGSNCDHLPGGPRPQAGYQQPHYGQQQYGYSQQGYDPYYDNYGYQDNSQLAGGPGYDPYSYQPQGTQPHYPAQQVNQNCRQVQITGRYEWVCQGPDGVWRPSN